jgi:hypothetical protein
MKRHLLTIITIFVLYVPVLVHGAEFIPLVELPGVIDPVSDMSTYINALYALSISIAALLAVIKIIIAGVKWMVTDVVTSKGEAKKDIQSALIGLLIVLAAVLILTVINPDLVNVNLTLNKPTGATFAGATTPAPTLTAPISTATVPGTATTIQYLTSTDSTQKQLFLESCKENTDKVTNPQVKRVTTTAGLRCLKYPPTEYSYAMTSNCSVTDCNSICDFDAGTGVGKYLADPDPLNKAVGYCVKPQSP